MNLREALKKFGKDVGINITAVRIYARQLLLALKHLSDLRIVHADIKLDNILCSGDLKTVKLCDFGSAFRETDTDNDPTPYLVSRFYRAPEIILGLPYDRAIDLWSIAVCFFELFTGHVMFPGRTNNEMLRLQMAVKGKPSNKIIKAHQRSYEVLNMEPFYDSDFRFKQLEMDPISGKSNIRLVDMTVPTKNLLAIIKSCKAGGDDASLVQNLADLIDKCISIDPTKRATVIETLKHPFFSTSK
jgi:serine/threonine-protein kinase PRP4